MQYLPMCEAGLKVSHRWRAIELSETTGYNPRARWAYYTKHIPGENAAWTLGG